MLQRFPRCNFHASLRAAVTSLAITFVLGLAAQAQTFTVIHSFSGPEGANPQAGLTLDGAGNLYGTSANGGNTSASAWSPFAYSSMPRLLRSLATSG